MSLGSSRAVVSLKEGKAVATGGAYPLSIRQHGALALAEGVGNAVEHDGRACHLFPTGAELRRFAGAGGATVPTLIRLIVVLGILVGLGYGALWALANWGGPKEREITFTVPPDRIGK
jgi:hypothetical protein